MENNILIGTRVDCLYRVSTDKQVDYDDKSQADIPMQRRECHRSGLGRGVAPIFVQTLDYDTSKRYTLRGQPHYCCQ